MGVYKLPIKVDVYTDNGVKKESITVTEKQQTFEFTTDARIKFVNVDAERCLLAVIQDNKPSSEYKAAITETPLFMDKDTCDEYVDEGYLIVLDDEDECSCDDTLLEEMSDKLDTIANTIDSLLEQYETDHKKLEEAYNNQEVPTCVKVEADTVYYNLTKVLNKIKDIINELHLTPN